MQSIDKKQKFAEISELKSHRYWKVLEESLEERKETKKKSLVRELLGNSDIDPKGLVEYTRGYIDGLQFAISAPENAERRYKELSAQREE